MGIIEIILAGRDALLRAIRHGPSRVTGGHAQCHILDLPNELLEQILEHLLIFDDPIEFAPLIKPGKFVDSQVHSPQSHQSAVTYRKVIRPTLGIFRVCKVFKLLGTRFYYGQNRFRFSNRYGWYALSRFLQLIGPVNRDLLRNITVSHSSHNYTIGFYELESVIERQLKPFGMADRDGFHRLFWTDFTKRLHCANTLDMLRDMPQLEELTFLFYPTLDAPFQYELPYSRQFNAAHDVLVLGGLHKVRSTPVRDWDICRLILKRRRKKPRILNLRRSLDEWMTLVGREDESKWQSGQQKREVLHARRELLYMDMRLADCTFKDYLAGEGC